MPYRRNETHHGFMLKKPDWKSQLRTSIFSILFSLCYHFPVHMGSLQYNMHALRLSSHNDCILKEMLLHISGLHCNYILARHQKCMPDTVKWPSVCTVPLWLLSAYSASPLIGQINWRSAIDSLLGCLQMLWLGSESWRGLTETNGRHRSID